MPQFPANIDLSNLDGHNGFKLSGEAAFDESGRSAASAGDVNGDGFADVIVGAFRADPHGESSGVSYVVFGKATGFAANLDLSSLNGSNGFKLIGAAVVDDSGRSVASAGDVNGDGFADFVVGAPFASASRSGASYVVFGKATGFAVTLELSSLDGSNGFTLNGVAEGDHVGGAVASAGDVNGDGLADLIVGASGADPNGEGSGASYVVFGKASGFAANLDLSSLEGSNGFQLDGVAAYDGSGLSVASAGDVNGDGFADVIVGTSSSLASYVVFGKATGFAANLDLSSLDGSNGFQLNGLPAYDQSGRSAAPAGDVNGDGFADMIVGARFASPHGTRSGASYVVFGKGSGFPVTVDLASLDGSNGFSLSGVAARDYSGYSVASAGDVNGDGFGDVIVGASYADTDSYLSGTSYVVFGMASGFAANLDLSSLDGSNGFQLSGVAVGDRSGRSVAPAGDVNGDGFGDLIVGASTADPHGESSGASYVIYGIAPDGAVHHVGTDASQTLAGGALDDVLSGHGGDDRLFGNGGDDTLNGGAGADTLVGGAGADSLNGAQGSDAATYAASPSAVTVNLETGVTLGGDAQGDTLTRIEDLTGSAFADTLTGNRLSNHLNGRDGNDTLNGGRGADTLVGGEDDDTYVVDNALDVVTEALNEGIDTVQASISYTLVSDVDNLLLTGTGKLAGTGNELSNTITGNGACNVLWGGDGGDCLVGGTGKDTLTGGNGADSFVLNASVDGIDTITDFVSESDWLEISAAGFGSGLVAGFAPTLTAAANNSAANSGTDSGYFIYDNVGGHAGTLYWDANGFGGTDAVAVAVLTGTPAMAAGDLHVV